MAELGCEAGLVRRLSNASASSDKSTPSRPVSHFGTSQSVRRNARFTSQSSVAGASWSISSSLRSRSSDGSVSSFVYQAAASCTADCFYHKVKLIVEWQPLVILMFTLAIFMLFGDDFRLVLFEKQADPVFNCITSAALLLFLLEIICTSIAVDSYFLSFFFLLDVVSTLSLILDLTMVWEFLVGYESFDASSVGAGNHDRAASELSQSDYARAGRSSRVGTRIARILRILKLIRLFRYYRFVTHFFSQGCVQRGRSQDMLIFTDEKVHAESRVGKKLSDRTTLRVIAMVLAMLVMVPILDPGDSWDSRSMMLTSPQYGADVIDQAWWDIKRGASNNSTAITQEQLKLEWSRQVFLYVQYHFGQAACAQEFKGNPGCDTKFLYTLCFIGFVADGAATNLEPISLSSVGNDSTKEDSAAMQRIHEMLLAPWASTCGKQNLAIYGVSLMSDMQCPWRTLRLQEIVWYSPFGRKSNRYLHGQFVFFFDVRDRVAWEAFMNILRTVFIVFVLMIGALSFSKDADRLVLLPIERMISNVDIIRRDPLYAIRLCSEQYRKQRRKDEKKQLRARSSGFGKACGRLRSSRMQYTSSSSTRSSTSSIMHGLSTSSASQKAVAPCGTRGTSLETRVLENTIVKLGSLLALGFGEAGSEIIGHNLGDDDGMVDVRIPGMKIDAIYGYCNIKNFVEISEVLQERTIVFVNQVAGIVHRIVDEHLGAPNKNVGEAFLLVWRMAVFEERMLSKLAELSVMSFIQITAAVGRDRELAEHHEHPLLLARLGNAKVSLGFGLHFGWAIEGAIGSEYKIDATYLSSHVNMAVRLEALTNQYGVDMLVTEPLVKLCSVSFAYHLRAIDHVKLHGSKAAIRLFTVDLDKGMLCPCGDSEKAAADTCMRLSHQRRSWLREVQREVVKSSKLSDSYQAHEIFYEDRHVVLMRDKFPIQFYQAFEKGYLNYEAGEWDVATQVLRSTRHMLSVGDGDDWEDGPSCALIEYMEGFKCRAPAAWAGYRHLNDKPFEVATRRRHSVQRQIERHTDRMEALPFVAPSSILSSPACSIPGKRISLSRTRSLTSIGDDDADVKVIGMDGGVNLPRLLSREQPRSLRNSTVSKSCADGEIVLAI